MYKLSEDYIGKTVWGNRCKMMPQGKMVLTKDLSQKKLKWLFDKKHPAVYKEND